MFASVCMTPTVPEQLLLLLFIDSLCLSWRVLVRPQCILFAHLQGSDFTADGHVYDSEAALVASAVKEACAPRGAAKSDSAPQAATEVFYRKVSSVCSRYDACLHCRLCHGGRVRLKDC